MSLMVRLEGLPPNAGPGQIQGFFTGLKIQPGGVNIIGGIHRKAFVTFMSSHNACLALKRSGKRLMGTRIYISLYTSRSKPGYLRISFIPLGAKLSDVKWFFKGLSIDGVIFLTRNKVRTGEAFVKFETIGQSQKALSAFQLLESKNSKKGHKKEPKKEETFSVLSMKKCSEKEWISSGGKTDPYPKMNNQASSACKWFPEMPTDDYDTLYIREFYAHLINVSLRVEKSDIRQFLYDLVGDSQITFLYDKNDIRQRECFVMFITENDYVRALELDKKVLKGRRLRVLPISKSSMMYLITSKREADLGNPVLSEEEVMEPDVRYLYLRNFAACVNKLDVLDFFTGFSLTEKDICLLYDHNGDSLGEALVKFSSKAEASKAEQLNHKRYQDTVILLRYISEEQLKVFGVDCFLNRSTANQDSSTKRKPCGADVCVSEADDSPEASCDAV